MSTQRDAVLLGDAQEIIARLSSSAATALAIDVRGGVVHMTGQIDRSDSLHRLRQALARIRGVHAVWDLVQVDGDPPLRVLDIGCGPKKQAAQAIGIDRYPHTGVAIVADLERGLPVADHSIDHVFAVHFLEHVHRLLPLLNDLHRVLRPGGILHVMVPHHASVNAVADPTHVRYFHPQTFKFMCRPYPGQHPFFPLLVSENHDTIFADLQPTGAGRPLADDGDLARYFD
jgi:SAM-dependent methyltransferase